MIEFLSITLIVITAGFLQGLTGFGFGLIALPLLSLFIPFKTIVPLTLMLSLFITLILSVQLRSAINRQTVAILFVATLPGIPVGIYLLKHVPSEYLAIFVGILMVSFTSYQMLATPRPMKLGLHFTLGAGLTSGILTGSLSTGGPPVIIYSAMQPWTKDQTKATLASYFFISGCAGLIAHFFSGIITQSVLTHFIYLFPAMIVGISTGTMAYKRLSDHGYRRLAIIFVFLLGIMMIAKNA